MKVRVVHFALEPTKKQYRAYFERGGYRDCASYTEAVNAVSETRGPAVRVDHIEIHTLWRRSPQVSPKEKP